MSLGHDHSETQLEYNSPLAWCQEEKWKMNLEVIIEALEVLFKWSVYVAIYSGIGLVLLKILVALFKKQIILALQILFS